MQPKLREIPSYDQMIREAAVAYAWSDFGCNPMDVIDKILYLYDVSEERVFRDYKNICGDAAVIVRGNKEDGVDQWVKTGAVA